MEDQRRAREIAERSLAHPEVAPGERLRAAYELLLALGDAALTEQARPGPLSVAGLDRIESATGEGDATGVELEAEIVGGKYQ
jgi:hypothetical protein